MEKINVPFLRPFIGEHEVDEVLATLRSGWLTTGPRVRQFEQEFAKAVGGTHAVALNSCTAALHLAVEALGLKPGQAVFVPTMTFAATAEVVRYLGAFPLLVDCDPTTLNMDLADAELKLSRLRAGTLAGAPPPETEVVGIVPVHVGGLMMNINEVNRFASKHGLWVVEDAAHSFPAAWRDDASSAWQRCGENTSRVSCFSFYANKTITTGEGGMAVTDDSELAGRMRLMSLHGLSHDAWGRYSGGSSWDYKIVAPGYKYNLTDIAAAIGIHQLAKAESMRLERDEIAHQYIEAFSSIEGIDVPYVDENRVHSWHLFPIRLRLEKLSIARNEFMQELKDSGVGCSVHWRPLHLHPYYEENFGWCQKDFPVASAQWERLISLPIFPGMKESEISHVIDSVKQLVHKHSTSKMEFAA
jgi:perosamine synthetase